MINFSRKSFEGWLSFGHLFAMIFSPALYAEDKHAGLEFDSRMLWGAPQDKANADLSRFADGNPVPAGDVKADLYLNGESQRSSIFKFVPVENSSSAVACFAPRDVLLLGLDASKLGENEALWLSGDSDASDCRTLDSLVPGAEAKFDFSEQRLETFIPQAYLVERPKDYISPLEWDRGINAARLNYSVDAFNMSNSGASTTQGYGYFESGINIEGWRVRNTSTFSVDESGHRFENQRSYAQTDIEKLGSTLTVGQNYTDGQIFNSYGLQGAFISTDVRMLPPSMRNYAPVVSGTADTTAKVTVRQGGVLVYERSVPPGPFEIRNVQLIGYGNDLEVEVTEADGTIKKYTVAYSPLVQLLRPGYSKYSASLGEAWAPLSNSYKPMVGQFNYQYGVNNYLTAFGGAVASEDYVALALGGAVSTFLGGLSADYTYADAHFRESGSSTGDSVRFIYSALYEPTGTNVTLSSYRFSSRGFWSFNEFVSNQESQLWNSSQNADLPYFFGAKQKGRFDMNLRQRLPGSFGSFSINGSTRNFWDHPGSDTQFRVSYSSRFKDLTYDVSVSRVKDRHDQQYNEYRLNFSVPIFSTSSSRNYISASTTRNDTSGGYAQVQLGGIAGSDQEITYGISSARGLDSENAEESYGLNGTYQGGKGFVTGSYTRGKGYQQTSLGLSGSVLAHADGVTLGQTLGETAALIEAKDASGARIPSANGAKVDGAGYGIAPYLSPYSRNRVDIDPEGLSSDITIADTSTEAIPVAGSIVRVKFDTLRENTVIINGVFEDGSPLPFGAAVLKGGSQDVVGYVGQAGSIFARGVDADGKLLVMLEGRSCTMSYTLLADGSAADSDRRALNKDRSSTVCKFK